jgi:DNA modification methylase
MKLKVSDIKANPANPRTISETSMAKLVKSLTDFPEMLEARPIILNKDYIILGGNMRYQAAVKAGITELPVKVVDWDEDKQREFVIKDNVSGGDWDWDILANEWDSDLLEDWGLELPDSWQEETEVEEDEAPEVSEEPPISKLGEIYQLGRHRVMCGDSTDKASVELLMNGVKADMVFTDPPYNVAQDSDNYASTASKAHSKLKDSGWDYEFDPSKFIGVLKDFVAQDCFIYIFTSHRLFGEIVALCEKEFGKSSFLVWCKPNPMPSLAKTTWTFATELIVTSRLGKPIFNYPDGEHCLNWLDIAKKGDGTHPTQKPLELCGKIINLSSAKDSIVLDLFLGSGSTLIACEQTNRTCYGMELDPKYVDVIRKRYAKLISPNNWEEEWESLTPRVGV